MLSGLVTGSMTNTLDNPISVVDSGCGSRSASQTGMLIINADDWGLDENNTDRISECVARGTVSSVSAMVLMEDSERGAAIARERVIDAGLHLNFTTSFSARNCSSRLREHQRQLTDYLRSHRFGRVVYRGGLVSSFEYVVSAQMEEYQRLYGQPPCRLDGHHHMHLCANVLLEKLLPAGSVVRRNETFLATEKGLINRLYRRAVDRVLARRHAIVDFFSTLAPVQPASRLQRLISLSRHFIVELETHPVDPDEYRLLTSGEIFERIGDLQIARQFALARIKHIA